MPKARRGDDTAADPPTPNGPAPTATVRSFASMMLAFMPPLANVRLRGAAMSIAAPGPQKCYQRPGSWRAAPPCQRSRDERSVPHRSAGFDYRFDRGGGDDPGRAGGIGLRAGVPDQD